MVVASVTVHKEIRRPRINSNQFLRLKENDFVALINKEK